MILRKIDEMKKLYPLLSILFLIYLSCEDRIITINPKIEYKKEILGNWGLGEDICLTFFDDGTIRGGEKYSDGIFSYTETLYYTITENKIQINSPKNMKDGISMNFSYSPSEDFSLLNIIHLSAEYYDGREPIAMTVENKFFTKRDDLVFQKPFYKK